MNTKTLGTDFEIARAAKMEPIEKVVAKVGLAEEDIDAYGKFKAKFSTSGMKRVLAKKGRGKLVLVTAITPTKAGEGKTTVSIGLAQGLNRLGKLTIAALREPSLGPVFGQKGGATGGGYAQLLPNVDINLHFNGDLHAIAAANNLLSAMIDNHIYFGNKLGIDSRTISFRRAVDMNDRSLRQIVGGLGGRANGYPQESGFNITAASEVMAAFCMAESFADLRQRLGRIVVAQDMNRKPISVSDLSAANAMAALLSEAVRPNLVQTLENGPAIVHGGPFANIAHGCSSVLGTKLSLKLAEFTVTESGFGADLGFEKFCDLVAAPRSPHLDPDCVVLVVTLKAVKLHGGADPKTLSKADLRALAVGMENVARHVNTVNEAGVPLVIAVNKFASDSQEELDFVLSFFREKAWPAAICDVWAKGGEGGIDLANLVVETANQRSQFCPFYDAGLSIMEKLEELARKVYGAADLEISPEAGKTLLWLNENGYGNFPVCVAKTQFSLSDDPTLINSPNGFTMRVREFRLSAGAGFVVALMGELSTMPGLPKEPAACTVKVDDEGTVLEL